MKNIKLTVTHTRKKRKGRGGEVLFPSPRSARSVRRIFFRPFFPTADLFTGYFYSIAVLCLRFMINKNVYYEVWVRYAAKSQCVQACFIGCITFTKSIGKFRLEKSAFRLKLIPRRTHHFG